MSRGELQPFELMQKAADFFERIGVPYRIVGSMATMAYGETRFTNDVDILVDLHEDQIDAVEQEFPSPDYYVSPPAIRDALRRRGQFNIIHSPSGLKLDVIQQKDNEFSRLDLSHGRRLANPGYFDAWFGSPENVILMKLRYYQEGGSDKHLRDIAGVLSVQKNKIDRSYIAEWAEKLGVSAEWQAVVERLGE